MQSPRVTMLPDHLTASSGRRGSNYTPVPDVPHERVPASTAPPHGRLLAPWCDPLSRWQRARVYAAISRLDAATPAPANTT